MCELPELKLRSKNFKTIYLVDSFSNWHSRLEYCQETDLVLTFDFELKKHINSIGGTAHYIDDLNFAEVFQNNNASTLTFLQNWYLDSDKNDIFSYDGIGFGETLRIYLWSEVCYFIRLCVSLEVLQNLSYDLIVLIENEGHIKNCLEELGIKFAVSLPINPTNSTKYYFDIHGYMDTSLQTMTLKSRLLQLHQYFYGTLRVIADSLFRSEKKAIYIQVYHPTLGIIRKLKQRKELRVITSNYIGGYGITSNFRQRLIPRHLKYKKFQESARVLLQNYQTHKSAEIYLDSGRNISDACHKIIENAIGPVIAKAIGDIVSTRRFLKRTPISLVVLISNLGIPEGVLRRVTANENVRTYMIINGLLNGDFGDQSSDADVINCYSQSIRLNYFKNSSKTVCLGDPRMDVYQSADTDSGKRKLNTRIVIGTSGFNSLDLTSFSAIEFEFIYEILTAIHNVWEPPASYSLTIKVRANGLVSQYERFVKQYFPDIPIRIVQKISIKDLLEHCDMYISTHSQTLFEASCAGVPVIYYKNHVESLHAPFDSNSELITCHSVSELEKILKDTDYRRELFQPFLRREIMEKYVGPLDGRNLDRNIEFILKLVNSQSIQLPA